jgi:glutamate dehydrogenase/leucine dehydrogenase
LLPVTPLAARRSPRRASFENDLREAWMSTEEKVKVHRDIAIEGVYGESFKVVVQTAHDTRYGTIHANTAVHDQKFARRIGGVRFVKGALPEHLTELGELASAMTWKSPLAGIPADGEKTVVYYPDKLPSRKDMAAILAEHLRELKQADPGVIFGPDIDCNEVVMERLAHVHGEGDHVSGLLHGKGGLSIDGQGYTARGLEAALLAAARQLGWDLSKMWATVQGFGAVGAHVANLLARHGVRLQAVSTKFGALVATGENGLDVAPLFAAWKERGDEAFQQFLASPPSGARAAASAAIWNEPAEIFIPAARTDVLAMPDEVAAKRAEGNRDVMDVTRFAERAGLQIVLEGANHPLTDAAEHFLEERGVFILPDYLVNCGGLVGCWADWVYRQELEGPEGRDWYERLNDSVPACIGKIVDRNVPNLLELNGGKPFGLRQATHDLARRRRTELSGHFDAFQAAGSNGDGRLFARNLMDRLLAVEQTGYLRRSREVETGFARSKEEDISTVDPLQLAFHLVLAGYSTPDLLQSVQGVELVGALVVAAQALGLRPDPLEILQALEHKSPDVTPPSLWHAWMRETRGPSLRSVAGDLSTFIATRGSGTPMIGQRRSGEPLS